MLDEEDGDAHVVADVPEELDDILGFLRVHAGRGFVEEQQLRVRSQRPGDLEAPLGTVGEVLGQLVLYIIETDIPHQAQGLDLGLLLLAVEPRQAQQGLQRRLLEVDVHANHDVLDDRHVGEEADVLEGPRDAAGGDLVRAQADQGLAVELDGTGVGAIDAGEGVEERRFPGTVGTDDGDDPPLLEGEGDVADRLQTTKGLGDICHFK